MAAATMYVTPAGAGAKNGSSWGNAFGEAEFETDLEGGAEAGDIYYVQAGTYTLDSSYDAAARDATTVAPISIIGVKAATSAEPPTVSDWPVVGSADRPTFACAANTISLGDYYKVYNCIFTGTSTGVLSIPTAGGVAFNCKSTNSSGSANRTAFSGGVTIACEGISTNGIAISACAKGVFNYAHDSVTGIDTAGNGTYLFNILDTLTTGFSVASDDNLICLGNTVYNCTTAFSATDAVYSFFINNIVDTVTDGFLWTSQINLNFFAYNHAGNSVTDMWDLVEESVAAHKDNWVTSGSPSFTDAAGGNFSLGTSSPCIDAGMAMALGVG